MPRGGARSGAGRPRKDKDPGRQKQSPPPGSDQGSKPPPLKGEIVTTSPFLAPKGTSPREFLLQIMSDPELPLAFRKQAAVDALPYCHPKFGELGKKAQAEIDAADAEKNGAWGDLLN
jgi:phage terminase small subunit